MKVPGTVAQSPDLTKRLIGHTAYDLDDFWAKRYGELFRRSVTIWRTEPVTGVGLKNFRRICVNDHYKAWGPVEDRCYTHPHQVYLEWLVETGAIGFLGFLALVGLWGRDIILGLRRIDPLDYPIAVGACAALIVFLWPLRSSMSFFSNWNAILFWLMLGLALARSAPRSRDASRSAGVSPDDEWRSAVALLGLTGRAEAGRRRDRRHDDPGLRRLDRGGAGGQHGEGKER